MSSIAMQAKSVPVKRVIEFTILDHALALDTEAGVLILFSRKGVQLQITCVAHFPPQELEVLLLLLTYSPDYCPQDAILAVLMMRDLEWCHGYIQRKIAEGQNRSIIMMSVRNVVGRIRERIKPMGLDVRAIMDTGYMFILRKET